MSGKKKNKKKKKITLHTERLSGNHPIILDDS